MITRAPVLSVCVLAGLAMAGSAVAQAPDVGTTRANPAVLGRMFANVCIGAQSAVQAENALRGVGMLDNAETGTFFHQEFDLSVNPGGGTCSMVFVTDQTGPQAIEVFRNSVMATHPGTVDALSLSSNDSNGEVYVRAGIEVAW